ncbi:MAG TPA: PDZ domain-containing protein [Pirellulales bacterium]|nr:PDZ domain-containing protein [Pirellulales bacterium]
MQTTFSRVAKLMAAPLAIAFLVGFGLAAAGAQDDDKDNSRSSRQASADDDSRNSSDSNRDKDQGSDASRQSDQHHKALGVTLNEDSAGNLYVLRVLRDSPAEKAGMKKGDEILTVDGHRVSHTNELKRALARAEDDTVELGILRRGRHQTMKATLADTDEVFTSESERNRAGNQRMAQNGRMEDGSANARRSDRRSNSYAGDNRNSGRMNYHRGAALGVALDRGPRDGAWVTDVFPNSPADEAGIQAGDEIVAIDGRKVHSAEEVIQSISQMQAGDRIALDVDRNGDAKTIKTKLVRHEDLAEGQYRMSRRDSRSEDDERGNGPDDDNGSRSDEYRGDDDR